MRARIVNRRVGAARAPRELVSRLGRAVLWLVVAVVLLRGLTATLATRKAPVPPRAASTTPAWPDDAARAFAAEFATAYLDQPPAATAGLTASGLGNFVVPELADQLALQPDPKGHPPSVRSVISQDTTRLDSGHALITVAALVGEAPARTLRLTVPVARDARGGLVVYDLPSLAAAPERATDAPPAGDPVTDSDERAAITDVLTRFLRAYLAGDRAGLTYLVPAGTRVGAVAGGFELLDVRSLTTVGPTSGGVRRVLVTVDARDRVSRAVMALRYRARLVRRDRWYVAELNTAGERDTMNLNTVSDGYLTRQARTGDGAAFAELARRYGNVINAATRWPAAPYTREDLRQEALVGLLEACRAHEFGRGFAPLVATCVRNRVRMARKQAARGKQRVLTDAVGLQERGERDGMTLAERLPAGDGIDPVRVVEAREQLQRIGAALRALSPRYRAALASDGTAMAGLRHHARCRLQQLLDRSVGVECVPRLEGRGFRATRSSRP